MGLTVRTNHFTKEQLHKARVAKALGHPARIAILEYIVFHQQCVCSDLVNEIQLTASTLNQHLKLLKVAGLLKSGFIGNKPFYCINETVWNETMISFNQIFKGSTKKNRLNC